MNDLYCENFSSEIEADFNLFHRLMKPSFSWMHWIVWKAAWKNEAKHRWSCKPLVWKPLTFPGVAGWTNEIFFLTFHHFFASARGGSFFKPWTRHGSPKMAGAMQSSRLAFSKTADFFRRNSRKMFRRPWMKVMTFALEREVGRSGDAIFRSPTYHFPVPSNQYHTSTTTTTTTKNQSRRPEPGLEAKADYANVSQAIKEEIFGFKKLMNVNSLTVGMGQIKDIGFKHLLKLNWYLFVRKWIQDN